MMLSSRQRAMLQEFINIGGCLSVSVSDLMNHDWRVLRDHKLIEVHGDSGEYGINGGLMCRVTYKGRAAADGGASKTDVWWDKAEHKKPA